MPANFKTIIARTSFLSLALSCLAAASYADVTYQPATGSYQPDAGYQPSYQPSNGYYTPATSPDPGQQAVTPSPVAPPVNTVTAGRQGRQAREQQMENAPPSANNLPLGTRSGIDAALDLSYYHYNETSADTRLEGPQIGGDAAVTGTFGDHMFDTLEGHIAYGRVDYDQSTDGTSNDHANFIWEVRDLVGKDFFLDYSVSLSPYIGLGYRSWYNDDRGLTSNNAEGFQRDSQYLYIPIGLKPEFRVNSSNIIVTDAEFDYLAHGWASSHLGDTGNGNPTIHTGQSNGFGAHLSAMWTTPTWSLGPYITYWNINDSDSSQFYSPNSTCGSHTCSGDVPRNITVEGGLQLKYHFLDF